VKWSNPSLIICSTSAVLFDDSYLSLNAPDQLAFEFNPTPESQRAILLETPLSSHTGVTVA